MGGSMSKANTRCENNDKNMPQEYSPPPVMERPLTVDQKMYDKVREKLVHELNPFLDNLQSHNA
jgi:hypothetical protein